MKIAFWSPVHGQSGVSTATATTAAVLALSNPDEKVLLMHNQLSYVTLERYLGLSKVTEDFVEKGIDPIIRLTKSGQLEADAVCDYADSLLDENNLDILTGSSHNSETIQEDIDEIIKDAIGVANQYYDYVIIDTHSGYENKTTKEILSYVDLVVVCLSQSLYVIDIAKSMDIDFGDVNVINLIGQYDTESSFTHNNISNKYKMKKESVYYLPYCTALKDALNRGHVLEFIFSNLEAGKMDDCFELMDSLKLIASNIKQMKDEVKD